MNQQQTPRSFKGRVATAYPLTEFGLWLSADLAPATVYGYVALVRSALHAVEYDPASGKPIEVDAVAAYFGGLAPNSRKLALTAWRRYAAYCALHGALVPVPATGRPGRPAAHQLPPAVTTALRKLHSLLSKKVRDYRPERIAEMTWGHIDSKALGQTYVSVPGCKGEYSHEAFYGVFSALRTWAFVDPDEPIDSARPLVPAERGGQVPLARDVLLQIVWST